MAANIIGAIRDLLINPNFDDMVGGVRESDVRNYDLIRHGSPSNSAFAGVETIATVEATNEQAVCF